MLRHNELYNPVKRPEKPKDIEFEKYVEMHKKQTAPTDHDLVKEIKDRFYTANSYAKEENLNKVWEFVGPKIERNVGLAEFTKDNNGDKSRYFFPWLINIFRSPSLALEISYGAGPDVDGKWEEHILATDDPFVPFVIDDPAFVYNRERQLYVADLATTIYEQAWDHRDVSRIVDFGAGRLAWVRRHGYVNNNDRVKIYAFDRDPSINLNEFFEKDPQKMGIYFKHGDLAAQLSNPNCRNASLIILGGVASYIPPEDFTGKIMVAIHGLLNTGGVFFFDLQTSTPCYRHSMDVLDWPEINLPDNPAIVIDSMEKTRKALWDRGIKFSAEYTVDTYNKIPSAVMITMQKI